jgi:hypothetical protein
MLWWGELLVRIWVKVRAYSSFLWGGMCGFGCEDRSVCESESETEGACLASLGCKRKKKMSGQGGNKCKVQARIHRQILQLF